MRVRFTTHQVIGGRVYGPGDEADLEPAIAQELTSAGAAEGAATPTTAEEDASS